MIEVKFITYNPINKEEWEETKSDDDRRDFFFKTKALIKKDFLKFSEGQSVILGDDEYIITKTIIDIDNIQWFVVVEPSTDPVPVGLIYGY